MSTAASSPPDTMIIPGQRPEGRDRRRAGRRHRIGQHAARRVQRHRVQEPDPGQPGEELPHPGRSGAEPGASGPRTVPSGTPDATAIRPEPLAPRRPRQHVPDHRRPVAPARQRPRRKQHVRHPARTRTAPAAAGPPPRSAPP